MLLALYDCRSKQEYIYRTNKIREISGASALLSKTYEKFIKKALNSGIAFADDGEWKGKTFSMSAFIDSKNSAQVVYIGGGALMVLYKDKDTYIAANKIFSRMLLSETWTVSAIVSCAEVTDSFIQDRKNVYAANAREKNTGSISAPCSVLPFTQVDMLTYMPVVKKESGVSLSKESVCKLAAYKAPQSNTNSIYLDDMVTEKGSESLLAVIYIDGNNMGAKLMSALGNSEDYDSCINRLRQFSENTNQAFVDVPMAAVENMLAAKQKSGVHSAKYRRVIAGGDEITLICNARIVPDIIETYFNALDSENSKNYACAGVALFHAHAPFADVYEIAEQCCNSGKKASRIYGSDANFVDFHFCRAGITNDMEIIREKQEKDLTARPYRIGGEHCGCSYEEFTSFAKNLKKIGRSNIKELSAAMIKGESYYRYETERINSRFDIHLENDGVTRKMIFDTAQVYDLWFAADEADDAAKEEQ